MKAIPPSGPVDGIVRLPGSKSITNRALVIAALVFVLDRASKFWIVEVLDLKNVYFIEVVDPFLNLTMAWNRGINFGLFDMGDAGRWVLIALALAKMAARRRRDRPGQRSLRSQTRRPCEHARESIGPAAILKAEKPISRSTASRESASAIPPVIGRPPAAADSGRGSSSAEVS